MALEVLFRRQATGSGKGPLRIERAFSFRLLSGFYVLRTHSTRHTLAGAAHFSERAGGRSCPRILRKSPKRTCPTERKAPASLALASALLAYRSQAPGS